MAGYAVVDVETTGLFPGGHDRVVEVAVVQVSPDGEPEASWTTLVNPGRDLGPQHVHGISAADVLRAPTFDRIAGALAELMAGRVFVAHNASFDMRFLRAEFAALGYDVPVVPETCLCTMRWAARLLPPGTPRTLAGCCAHVGIPLEGAHAALVDARATAALLAHYLRLLGEGDGWADAEEWWLAHELAETVAWPAVPKSDAPCCPRGAGAAETQVPLLSRLVDHLPGTTAPEAHREYLAMLDRALLDRFLSVRERDGLVALADELGIGRATAAQLHHEYLERLARAAVLDGVVTEDERLDLLTVAELLSVEKQDALAMLERAAAAGSGPGGGAGSAREGGGDAGAAGALGPETFQLQRGDMVVFTGEMSLPREEWVRRAMEAGLVPHSSVTKKVALVVAADPDSLSGKARKAEAYGIPIVGEWAFEELIRRM